MSNDYSGSVSGWIEELKAKNPESQKKIWDRLAERRIIDQVRKELSIKHGNRKTFSESDSGATDNDFKLEIGEVAHDPRPTPDVEAIMSEELEYRLDLMGDDMLRAIAINKMNDFRNQEIATKIGKSLRSVERKLLQIRQLLDPSRV